MKLIGQDRRVRYAPELGVWTVDMETMHYTGGAPDVLASAMHYAREAGQLPDCTCFPDVSVARDGMNPGVEASAPKVHAVLRAGGGAFSILGHGMLGSGALNAEAGNATMCPLANAEGEAEAKRLYEQDRTALWNATEPFPAPDTRTLEPAAPGAKAPKVWTGKEVRTRRGTVPARHVPAEVRASMARLASIEAHSERLDREAREAKQAASEAPAEARRAVAEAAAAGETPDAAAVTAIVRERQEQAETAQALADGTRDAVESVRREVAGTITEQREEWLAYLHEHAAHGLARLDLVIAELGAALEDLAEIDRVRQTVEAASTSALFNGASVLAMGAALDEARQSRARVAETLGGLARRTAKAEAAR
ncbi:hypothetical protein [Actinoplanes sp. NPDC049802]|uniref:hypothetical protein n=1 Tax=Actinoplanes sp. NPDC049802 TaxID=3154742 RepID=UPI0034043A70